MDDLLKRGYYRLTILDVSKAALDVARARLGGLADRVNWICADITQVALADDSFDVWHDRAVFHFLTEPTQRDAYVQRATQAVKSGGHVIVSTFGPEGPKKCSGLDVVRYDADSLRREFGERFELVESSTELHETPFHIIQQFLYCHLRHL